MRRVAPSFHHQPCTRRLVCTSPQAQINGPASTAAVSYCHYPHPALRKRSRLQSWALQQTQTSNTVPLCPTHTPLPTTTRTQSPPVRRPRQAALRRFGRDLSEEARRGLLDPLLGRQAVVHRLLQVLLRRSKNNPLLLGEAGVGKTAIVEGLAQLLASPQAPPA